MELTGENVNVRSNKVILLKICLLCPVLSLHSIKCLSFYFWLMTTGNVYSCVRKSDAISLTWFFGHFTAQNKDNTLKFRSLVVGIRLNNVYSMFAFCVKTVHSRTLGTFAFFYLNGETWLAKTLLSEKNVDIFSESLMKDVKVMSDRVLKASC